MAFYQNGKGRNQIVSRSEFAPDGVLTLRRVLRRFERTGMVLNLHVAGRVIGTTAEHPFYERQKGWTPAHELRLGDEIKLLDGGWQRVDGVADSGRVETVYNLEIEDDHTYFVGADDWGFAVWAHNACNPGRTGKQPRLRSLLDDPNVSRADKGWIQQELNQIARGKRNSIRLPGSSRIREINGVEYGGQSGKVLAHKRGLEARKGHGYENADLQDVAVHKLQHKHEGYK